MVYATPPITTVTSYGPIASYSLVQQAPALLTQFVPPSQCSTDWYWDTGVLRSSSTAFSDSTHNTNWATCQPYSASSATYSAGICPASSEFKSATKVYWDGVSEAYYVGACCGSSSTLSVYRTVSISETQLACFATATQSLVVATIVQEDLQPTPVTSAGPITIIAEPLYMVWHQNDTSLHPASDAASLRAAMGMVVASSTWSNFPSPTFVGQSSTFSPSLSAGAKAGIAIGCIACFSALATLGYFAYRRRWKRKAATSPSGPWTEDGPGSGHSRTPATRSETSDGQWPRGVEESVTKSGPTVGFHAVDSPVRRSGDEIFGIEQKTLLR